MTSNNTRFARELVALSLDSGVISAERVGAILQTLAATRKHGKLRPLLRAFQFALQREIARGEARIEFAGAISQDAIEKITAHFSEIYARKMTPVPLENPDLIAGIRVRIGDDIFEDSIQNSLSKLHPSKNAIRS